MLLIILYFNFDVVKINYILLYEKKMSKKILVTGSSGYVANYLMLTMAKRYP